MSAQVVLKNAATPAVESNGATRVRLRLTRRGRVVFGLLATVAVAALLAFVAAFAASPALALTQDADGPKFSYVVAQPGDSLWSIASSLDPEADPRDVVAEIVRLNQLSSSGIDAGQAIAVPLQYSDHPVVFDPSAE